MSIRTLVILFISMIFFIACGEDEGSNNTNSEGLAVEIHSANPDDPNDIFTLGQDEDHKVDFCYADGECDYWDGTYGGSGIGGSGAGYAIMSEKGREVVGANINLYVSSGAGTAKIVAGTVNDDDSWDPFEVDSVIEDLGSFSEGDSLSYSYGEME